MGMELMAYSLIYLQVSVFVWMWLCVLSSMSLPISLFCSTGLCPFRCFLFVSVCPIHPHHRPLVSLVLTAHACPRCPILYSDLPWWCSIKIFFNLQVAIEAVIACDCIVVDETWAGIRPELSPCCHPQVPLVLCLLFFPSLSPSFLPSISLSLSHQVSGARTSTSNADSSYLSSWQV